MLPAEPSASLHAAFVNDRHPIKAVGPLSGAGQATRKLVRLKLLETGRISSAKVSMSLVIEFSVLEALHGILGARVSPALGSWRARLSRRVPREAAGALSGEGRAPFLMLCTHD